MKTFYEFSEAIQPWILHNKYDLALRQLQSSRYFQGRRVDPQSLNLSAGQLKQIFGDELPGLMQTGIVVRRPGDNNPFGGSSASYTLAPPQGGPAGANPAMSGSPQGLPPGANAGGGF